MSEIIVSSSSDRDEGEIDEYLDKSNNNGSTSEVVIARVVLQTSITCLGFL